LKNKKRNIGGILFGGVFVVSGLAAFIGICVEELSQYNTDWSTIAFGTLFLAIFGGVGGGVMHWAMNITDVNDLIAQARTKGLFSEQKGTHGLLYKIGSLPLAVAVPIFVAGIFEQKNSMYVGLGLAAIGLIFFAIAKHKKKQYMAIGTTLLELSPIPGSIGGQVGMRFLLKAKPRGESLKLRLDCRHTYSSGSGDSRSTHSDFLFQEEAEAYLKYSPSGYEVCGVFDVPDRLPETDASGYKGTISWNVMSTGLIVSDDIVPGTQVNAVHEFKRSWVIPVLKGKDKSSLRIPTQHTEQAEAASLKQARASAVEQIQLEASKEGLQLTSESGRNSSMWLFLIGFGALFTAAGCGLTYVAYTNNPLLWLMAPIFLLVGLGIMLSGIFISGRKLETKFNGSHFQVTRSLFGIQLYSRQGRIEDVSQFTLKSTMSSTGQDGLKAEYMAIYGNVVGKNVKLVEGIKGRKAGEAMLDRLKQELSL
jgi:hypothetical protein